jgi:hypothetical protein
MSRQPLLINTGSALICSGRYKFFESAAGRVAASAGEMSAEKREFGWRNFDQMTIKVSLEQMSCAKVVRSQVRPVGRRVHLAIVAAINNALGAIAFGFRLPEMASARKLVGIC